MFLNIILLLFLASCDKKEPIEVKQITSKEFVTIEDNYMDRHLIKDSVRMSIPLKFEININSTKVKYITWNYRVDNKFLDKDYFDYEVFSNEDKTKPIF
ncbi:hypothetical protein KHA90_18155 [Flavobacterium psychroterrae]|uniref:Lipoprotein n=1 Tax=Flavobacterium psychroterrae TaxID=2133767 RepID=A0ABS5PF66_9FLAO|nr:hypothetical protein [Flavobacterium psychroterrae]MBS7232947.1 hypothetical protein [Flavobacterium psychroterrae]